MRPTHLPFILLLFVFVCLETLCQVYFLKEYNRETISVCYLLLGLAIGIIPLWKVQRSSLGNTRYWRWIWAFLGVVFVYAIIQTKVTSGKMIHRIPLAVEVSDVLPIMQVMCKRMLEGGEVYAIIPEIWGGMQPIYLPTMWLPYLPSVALHFDPRWVTVAFILFSLALVMIVRPAQNRPTWWSLLVLVPIVGMSANYLHWDNVLIGMSDEGVVIGWYTLLGWALWHRNPWLIGFALAMSVLARISLLTWIPFLGLFVWLFESRRNALIIAGTSGVLGLLLMFWTKAIFYLDVFAALPRRYMEAVTGSDYEKLKPTIVESLGIAKFYIPDRLPMLQQMTYLATVGAPLVCLLLFWKFRHRMDARFWPLATLKITLTLFYSMLIIPASNLFYPSGFLSLLILIFYSYERTGETPNHAA